MSALVRTASGAFDISDSIPSAMLTEENLSDFIIPTQNLLPFKDVRPTGDDAKRLFNGLSVNTELADGLYKIYDGDVFYGLAEANKSFLKIRTKLC